MSNQLNNFPRTENVIQFPLPKISDFAPAQPKQVALSPTPVSNALEAAGKVLDDLSSYRCEFDYTVYKDLERRYKDRPIRGGIVFSKPFKLVNAHHTCQQCLYAFEIDTYGRGCVHECAYCYAKAQLTVHGYWNNPIPVPIDINEVRKTFYTVFETDKRHKLREILLRKTPLRIGSMTDSFMWSDKKYGVTKELLKLLQYYNYPNIIFTRSDLVAHDDYLNVMSPQLTSVQMSISSVNDEMNRAIEPGAPSAKRRLQALKKLGAHGFWTTVRINPMFPIFPDGYFTDKTFTWDGEVPKFEYTSFDMIDAIADANVPAVLAGFVRFSSFAINNIKKATGIDLRVFYRKDQVYKSRRDWHYSDREIRHYYEQFYLRSKKRGIQFTTCYIGNGESHFWKDQDLWSNKRDCCNVKDRIAAFKTDSRDIPFVDRIKISNQKSAAPVSAESLHSPLGEQIVVPLTRVRNEDPKVQADLTV